MDIDATYKLLMQKFMPIRNALLKRGVHGQRAEDRAQETEASTELDGILWELAQGWRPKRVMGNFTAEGAESAEARKAVEELIGAIHDDGDRCLVCGNDIYEHVAGCPVAVVEQFFPVYSAREGKGEVK